MWRYFSPFVLILFDGVVKLDFDGVKGLVLCGGPGIRLRPLTYYFQKGMIPVGSRQKPCLEYIIRLFKYNEVKDVLLLVGYKAEQVRNYFGDGSRFNVNITYIYDKPGFEATGGAVLNAYKNGAIKEDDTLLIYYGDILSNICLNEMLTQHFEEDAAATVALAKGYHVPVGVAQLKGSYVESFVEKPLLDLSVGIGILALRGRTAEDLEHLHKLSKKVDLMRDLLPYLIQNGKPVTAYLTDAFWYDVGSIERYEKLDNDVIDNHLSILFADDSDRKSVV